MIRLSLFPVVFFFSLLSFSQTPTRLVEHPVQLKKGISFNLKIPEGYKLSIAAEGLKRPRFFAKSPDGRLFVTDMLNVSDNKEGKILVLENWNEKEKRFEKVSTWLDSLHNPNQVAFYSIDTIHYIYIAETGKLSYYKYKAGDPKPSSAQTVIATFPDYGLSYKYGGWHLTRSLSFYKNKLYVSVGSSCDACVETEEIRASIVEMDPDGKNQHVFARGLRNAVGMKWVNDKLWVTHMGRDNRGPDKPEELMHTVVNDGYYGWPYYFQYRKKIYSDTAFIKAGRAAFVKKPALAPYTFKAHSAPLGLTYFTGFTDPLLNNSFLVALHGSTSVWRQRGNAVVQVMKNGTYREIVTGFLQGKTEDKRYGRPCDIYQQDSRSFFISDDKNGVIYYIWKE
ncbi:MAG TPA: PQQ-dependent sugar dehydrogenase [Chitinophagaceae bacterium]|nr:PQQ-dependent sugar dehydrogenase [Chitinophagaceae bacterium]